MFFSMFILAFFLASITFVNALLSGSARITPQDYLGLLPAPNNPPACGMPYASLDVTRIVAVQALNRQTDCNKCIKVMNSNDPSKFVYVLAVDLGGIGLDLSIPSFKKLFGQQYDASPASWSETDYSHCAGIYKDAPLPSSSSSSIKPRPTATSKPKPTRSPTPSVPKKKKKPHTPKKKKTPKPNHVSKPKKKNNNTKKDNKNKNKNKKKSSTAAGRRKKNQHRHHH